MSSLVSVIVVVGVIAAVWGVLAGSDTSQTATTSARTGRRERRPVPSRMTTTPPARIPAATGRQLGPVERTTPAARLRSLATLLVVVGLAGVAAAGVIGAALTSLNLLLRHAAGSG